MLLVAQTLRAEQSNGGRIAGAQPVAVTACPGDAPARWTAETCRRVRPTSEGLLRPNLLARAKDLDPGISGKRYRGVLCRCGPDLVEVCYDTDHYWEDTADLAEVVVGFETGTKRWLYRQGAVRFRIRWTDTAHDRTSDRTVPPSLPIQASTGSDVTPPGWACAKVTHR